MYNCTTIRNQIKIITMAVDLRKCVKGDILISKHGAILRYLGPTDELHYYDHIVEYIFVDGEINTGQLGNGTRLHDGYTFRKNRLETDHDIVSVIPLNVWEQL